MSERSIHYVPTFPSFFSKLFYSNALGIMRSPEFAIRDYKEDNFVLIYTARGCLFCEQDGRSFTCREGEYVFLDKRRVHSYWFDKSIPSEILWIHTNGELANDIAAQINAFSKLCFVGKEREVHSILQECLDLQSGGNTDPFELSALISKLLHAILKEAYAEHQKNIYSPEEYDFRAKLDAVLGADDLSDITLDALCEKMRMNKYYFSHQFKKYYGDSPIKHIHRLRLEKAKCLIGCSDMKIGAIAKKYGFSSHTYFSSAFKKQFGISPEEYRSSKYTDRKESDK